MVNEIYIAGGKKMKRCWLEFFKEVLSVEVSYGAVQLEAKILCVNNPSGQP